MANWQRNLNLKDVWDLEKSGLTIQQLAAITAQRLRELQPFNDSAIEEERYGIAEEFDALAEDPSAGADDFDLAMERLYDWGDLSLDGNWNGRKVCWIATF